VVNLGAGWDFAPHWLAAAQALATTFPGCTLPIETGDPGYAGLSRAIAGRMAVIRGFHGGGAV
jgi:hypothetical protein